MSDITERQIEQIDRDAARAFYETEQSLPALLAGHRRDERKRFITELQGDAVMQSVAKAFCCQGGVCLKDQTGGKVDCGELGFRIEAAAAIAVITALGDQP